MDGTHSQYQVNNQGLRLFSHIYVYKSYTNHAAIILCKQILYKPLYKRVAALPVQSRSARRHMYRLAFTRESKATSPPTRIRVA